MEQSFLHRKGEKPKRKFEHLNKDSNLKYFSQMIPVITNNTELDTLIHFLPILELLKNENHTIDNGVVSTILQMSSGDRNVVLMILMPYLRKFFKVGIMEQIIEHSQNGSLISSESFLKSLSGALLSAAFCWAFFRREGITPKQYAMLGGGLFASNLLLISGINWKSHKTTKTETQEWKQKLNHSSIQVDEQLIDKIVRAFHDMTTTLKHHSYNPSNRFNLKDICNKLKPFQALLALILLDLGLPYEKVHQIVGPFFHQIQTILNPVKPLEFTSTLASTKGFPTEVASDLSNFYGIEEEEYFSPEEYEERDESLQESQEEELSQPHKPAPLVFHPDSIELGLTLEDRAARILATEGIHVYKPHRFAMSGCRTEDQFKLHTYWIRDSFSHLIQDSTLRQEFSRAGKELTVSLLDVVGGGTQDFIREYDNFLDFIQNNLDAAQKDVQRLPVRYLSAWDIFVEYTLVDSFEQLEKVPSSLKSMLQWTPQSAKFALVQKFVVSGLDEKVKEAKEDNNQFREKYLMALKHVAPWLLLGFLNSDREIANLFVDFKDLFLEFYKNLFSIDLKRINNPKEHQDQVLKLSRKMIEDAINLSS